MSEDTIEVKKKKKWLVPVIIGAGAAVLVVIAAIVIAVVVSAGAPKRALQKQLDLGKMYLTELDYDNAITAFEEAIKVDPNCVEAYLGLGDAYLGKADELQAKENYQGADDLLDEGIEKLQTGLDNTKSPEIEDKIGELKKKKDEIVELQEKLIVREMLGEDYEEAPSFMDEIAKNLSEEKYLEAMCLLQEEEYTSLCQSLLDSNVETRLYNTQFGAIGLYKNPNAYMSAAQSYFIYYGGYLNGIRQGKGAWMSVSYDRMLGEIYRCACGSFDNNLPNGEFIEYSYHNLYNMNCGLPGYTGTNPDFVFSKQKMNVKDGLYDGRIYYAYEDKDYEESWMYSNGYLVNYELQKESFYEFWVVDNDYPDLRMFFLSTDYYGWIDDQHGLDGFSISHDDYDDSEDYYHEGY